MDKNISDELDKILKEELDRLNKKSIKSPMITTIDEQGYLQRKLLKEMEEESL